MRSAFLRRGGLALLAAILLASAFSPAQVLAEGAKRAVILPFEANSQDNISYLVKGIRDILASRLAWQDKVTVVEPDMVAPHLAKIKPPLNTEKARSLGKDLKADVVVFGTITKLGDSVSVDAKVVRTGEDSPPLTAFVQTEDMNQVIPRINDFAQRINADIFARPEAVAARKAGAAETKTASSSSAPSAPGVLPEGGENMSPLNPLFLKQLFGVESDRFWRSPRIDGAVVGVGVGDVDMDGKNELVTATEDRVRIYRLTGEYFSLIYELKNGPRGRYLSLDVADIDGDGRPEIFVSNLNSMSVQSFVLHWDKTGFTYKATDVPYYFRAQIRPNGEGYMLFGQQSAVDMPFFGPIYELGFKDGTYKPIREMPIPDVATIFSFCLADLNGTGDPLIVLVGPSYYMRVYSESGRELYASGERFCASDNFIRFVKSAGSGPEDTLWYIHTRLLPVDMDHDGKQEIVAVQNADRTDMMLSKMRMFYQGTIYSLSWNGMTMVENWRTPRIGGYVADYWIADVGNVGQPSLVMAVNQRLFQGMLEKGVGNIVAFTLRLKEKQEKR